MSAFYLKQFHWSLFSVSASYPPFPLSLTKGPDYHQQYCHLSCSLFAGWYTNTLKCKVCIGLCWWLTPLTSTDPQFLPSPSEVSSNPSLYALGASLLSGGSLHLGKMQTSPSGEDVNFASIPAYFYLFQINLLHLWDISSYKTHFLFSMVI